MLTVMRDMATSIARDLAHLPEEARRLGAEADVETQNAMIAVALERAIVAGEASVKRGPELLPALREAGVVDAGGYGVIIIFAGIVAALKGSAPELQHYAPAARVTHPEHASETYRYCTNFAVTGSGLESARFVPQLERIGDSILVVGDHATLKVHVHTDEPQQATEIFERRRRGVAPGRRRHARAGHRARGAPQHGRLGRQRRGRHARAGRDRALLRRAGRGPRRRPHCPVRGPRRHRPRRRPDAQPLHDGDPRGHPRRPRRGGRGPAEHSNVFMAAERAAELSDKKVVVVPSRSQQAGLSAAFALTADRSADENAAAMLEALEAVRTGGVAPAARQDPEGRFAIGDAVGYVGDDLVAWGEPSKTLRDRPRAAVGRRRAGHLHRGRGRAAGR